MNVTAVTTTLEARAEAQLSLIGDPAIEDAGRAILEEAFSEIDSFYEG